MKGDATAAAGVRTAASNYQGIMRNPTFGELVASRSRFSWTLSALMLAIYLGFILLVAFGKPLLAQKIGGGTVSLGIVLGLGVIIAAFVLTAAYVVRANGHFDTLTEELRREMEL